MKPRARRIETTTRQKIGGPGPSSALAEGRPIAAKPRKQSNAPALHPPSQPAPARTSPSASKSPYLHTPQTLAFGPNLGRAPRRLFGKGGTTAAIAASHRAIAVLSADPTKRAVNTVDATECTNSGAGSPAALRTLSDKPQRRARSANSDELTGMSRRSNHTSAQICSPGDPPAITNAISQPIICGTSRLSRPPASAHGSTDPPACCRRTCRRSRPCLGWRRSPP